MVPDWRNSGQDFSAPTNNRPPRKTCLSESDENNLSQLATFKRLSGLQAGALFGAPSFGWRSAAIPLGEKVAAAIRIPYIGSEQKILFVECSPAIRENIMRVVADSPNLFLFSTAQGDTDNGLSLEDAVSRFTPNLIVFEAGAEASTRNLAVARTLADRCSAVLVVVTTQQTAILGAGREDNAFKFADVVLVRGDASDFGAKFAFLFQKNRFANAFEATGFLLIFNVGQLTELRTASQGRSLLSSLGRMADKNESPSFAERCLQNRGILCKGLAQTESCVFLAPRDTHDVYLDVGIVSFDSFYGRRWASTATCWRPSVRRSEFESPRARSRGWRG